MFFMNGRMCFVLLSCNSTKLIFLALAMLFVDRFLGVSHHLFLKSGTFPFPMLSMPLTGFPSLIMITGISPATLNRSKCLGYPSCCFFKGTEVSTFGFQCEILLYLQGPFHSFQFLFFKLGIAMGFCSTNFQKFLFLPPH